MDQPDPDIRARLEALRQPDEIISPVAPEGLMQGGWYRGPVWPAALRAGVLEPRRGFRFRPENLALAHLLSPASEPARVVELGAGSGSMLLIAHAFLREVAGLVAVEQQQQVAARLRRTLEAHRLGDARVIEGDLRHADIQEQTLASLGGPADCIVMNPPYFPEGWGLVSKQRSTRLSTHAVNGDVSDFLHAARALLKPGGEVLVVYDADRLATLMAAAGEAGLRMGQLVWIPDGRPGREDRPLRVWVRLSQMESGVMPERLGS